MASTEYTVTYAHREGLELKQVATDLIELHATVDVLLASGYTELAVTSNKGES